MYSYQFNLYNSYVWVSPGRGFVAKGVLSGPSLIPMVAHWQSPTVGDATHFEPGHRPTFAQ